MAIQLGLAIYDHPEGAERAFVRMRETHADAAWFNEIAFVEKHRHERVVIRGTFGSRYVSVDDIGDAGGRNTLIGMLTGALVGMAFGPAGVTAGFVTGMAAGGLKDSADSPLPQGALVEEMRADIPKNHSAIVLLADSTHVDEMFAALELPDDRIIRRILSDDDVAALEHSIADVPAAKHGETHLTM